LALSKVFKQNHRQIILQPDGIGKFQEFLLYPFHPQVRLRIIRAGTLSINRGLPWAIVMDQPVLMASLALLAREPVPSESLMALRRVNGRNAVIGLHYV
jgi:hypothetical protein